MPQAAESTVTYSAIEAGERSGHPGLTSYEAWCVALAEFLGVELATLNTRLALVPGLRCPPA